MYSGDTHSSGPPCFTYFVLFSGVSCRSLSGVAFSDISMLSLDLLLPVVVVFLVVVDTSVFVSLSCIFPLQKPHHNGIIYVVRTMYIVLANDFTLVTIKNTNTNR